MKVHPIQGQKQGAYEHSLSAWSSASAKDPTNPQPWQEWRQGTTEEPFSAATASRRMATTSVGSHKKQEEEEDEGEDEW